MERPNLFSFATSELSQDAFLSWLLSWADQRYEASDPALHAVGQRLVERLLALHGHELPSGPLRVSVQQQWKKLDVLALINEQIVILIEDKVHTRQHSDQLRRYLGEAREQWPKHALNPVYVQTGDQDSYHRVRQQGWEVFHRADLLQVLAEGELRGIQSDIFRDFYRHLRGIEHATQTYRTRPPSDGWHRAGWRGFFVATQKALGEGGWHYVANPSGGFMGFYWNWVTIPHGKLYLQLEEERLCVKVEVKDRAKRKEVRGVWWRLVTEAATPTLPFERPKRLGSGTWMTVAVFHETTASQTLTACWTWTRPWHGCAKLQLGFTNSPATTKGNDPDTPRFTQGLLRTGAAPGGL